MKVQAYSSINIMGWHLWRASQGQKNKGNRLISVAKTQSRHGEEKEPHGGKLKSMGLII